jgi:hypothetical protein
VFPTPSNMAAVQARWGELGLDKLKR